MNESDRIDLEFLESGSNRVDLNIFLSNRVESELNFFYSFRSLIHTSLLLSSIIQYSSRTEVGVAPDPTWSTGTNNDGGDPDIPVFNPVECDTTLQQGDRWFWV